VKKSEPPSQEEFDKMLDWFDADRDRAGEKYEQIRARLIKILERRQCYVAEELADETINRVSHRVEDIAPTYVGDPALYFYGVMRKVYQEWIKLDRPLPNPEPVYVPDSSVDPDPDRVYECLEECLKKLGEADRDTILKYYEKDGRAKINYRKELAARMEITLNTLRMKVHRINVDLRKCMDVCLDAPMPA
jgi:DNA-directed RNA polymerase specialized sigma24 family protein